MKRHPTVRVGDVIEITHRVEVLGIVDDTKADGQIIRVEDDETYWLDHDTVTLVEIIERAPRKFQVGDAVSGDDYAQLPVGTVVRSKFYTDTLCKTDHNAWLEIVAAGLPYGLVDSDLNDVRLIIATPSHEPQL